jgi:hypothetical protein
MLLLGLGTLACVSSTLLASVMALGIKPNRAEAELLVVPKNVTFIIPQTRKSGFERQPFDFGSARSGFSELKRVLERQNCQPGWGYCSQTGVCCPTGGDCCAGGGCCGSGQWCYGNGCCLLTEGGCDDLVSHFYNVLSSHVHILFFKGLLR